MPRPRCEDCEPDYACPACSQEMQETPPRLRPELQALFDETKEKFGPAL